LPTTSAQVENVFINCPFDPEYRDIFRSIVFTVICAGLVPRCALEAPDSMSVRLDRIVGLIRDCKYAIHDISRVELDANGLPRFNMPFELGLYFGAKHFGNKNHKCKECLILDKERYRYQKFLSDLSGCDPVAHGNDVKKAIRSIRDWLVGSSKVDKMPSHVRIHDAYQKFDREFKEGCTEEPDLYEKIPYVEFTKNISNWIEQNPF